MEDEWSIEVRYPNLGLGLKDLGLGDWEDLGFGAMSEYRAREVALAQARALRFVRIVRVSKSTEYETIVADYA